MRRVPEKLQEAANPAGLMLLLRRRYGIIQIYQMKICDFGEKGKTMLTNAENAVIALLRSSITGDTAVYAFRCGNAEEALPLAKIISINGIVPTVYPCLDVLGEPAADVLKNELRESYYSSVSQSVLQDSEGRAFINALSAGGMDCIPLKGWLLRELYPDFTRRSMADLDILVRDFDYAKVRPIAHSLGYTSSGDSTWKHVEFRKAANDTTVEVHRRLTDEDGEVAKWEKGIFERAVPEAGETHLFRMSDEDFYVFHILHLFKDFGNGRFGLRRVADTWLYLRKYPDMDRSLLAKRFETMGLSDFVHRVEKLARVVFGDESMDENCEILIRHACTFGIFGTNRSYKLGRIARMSGRSLRCGKLRSAASAVFLPCSRMKTHYPVLRKAPVMLPFCWIARIFQYRHGIKGKLQKLNYSELDDKDFEYMKKVLRAGGLKV